MIAETTSDVPAIGRKLVGGSKNSRSDASKGAGINKRLARGTATCSEDASCKSQPEARSISFLQRMNEDVTKRRTLKDRVSPLKRKTTPRGQIALASPPMPKNPQNTPKVHCETSS